MRRQRTDPRAQQLSLIWDEPSLLPDPQVSTEKQETNVPLGKPSDLEKAIWKAQEGLMAEILTKGPLDERRALKWIRCCNLRQTLFDWGTRQGYPEYRIRVNGRVCMIIAPGITSWYRGCIHSLPVMRAAIAGLSEFPSNLHVSRVAESERVERDAVMTFGQSRGWYCFDFRATITSSPEHSLQLAIDDGEQTWKLFAYGCDFAYVSQALTQLRQQMIRDAVYDEAAAYGWPRFSFRLPDSPPNSRLVMVAPHEPDWRTFAAYQGYEHVNCVYTTLFQKRGMAI